VFRAYDPNASGSSRSSSSKSICRPSEVTSSSGVRTSDCRRSDASDLSAPRAAGIADVAAYLVQDYIGAESLDLASGSTGAARQRRAARGRPARGRARLRRVGQHLHGALHPRDVLLSTDDTRLTGVGVARALEQVGVTAPVRRPYTAPERMAGAFWDRRADVFSLAALLHELLWARA
jgi:hypothetical protein